jgi:hypothetical protein
LCIIKNIEKRQRGKPTSEPKQKHRGTRATQ